MRSSSPVNRAIETILNRQGEIIMRSQALACGMTEAMLRAKLRPGGPWTVVLPGVYLARNGLLTISQREMAAALYGGPKSVITGLAAVTRHGIRAPGSEIVDVLIPDHAKRGSQAFVRVHRTARMPERPWQIDGLRWTPPARAVTDAARAMADLRDVRALVADAVQKRKCTVQQLLAELRAGPAQGSAPLRAALGEVTAGVLSVAEGDLRKLIKRSGLPEPMYNPMLYLDDEFIGQPDDWWPDAGVAGQVDSREWHLSPADWQKTMARHNKMSECGIIVLHFTPRQIRTESAKVTSELRAAIDAGLRRPRLPIRAVPSRQDASRPA